MASVVMRSTRGKTRGSRIAATAHFTAQARVTQARKSTERARYGAADDTLSGIASDTRKRAEYPSLNTMANRKHGGPSMYYRMREGIGQ